MVSGAAMPAGYHAGRDTFKRNCVTLSWLCPKYDLFRLALGCREVTTVGRPDWRDGERRVAVAPVMRHLAPEPARTRERLVGIFQLDLGQHQAAVAAAEHVDRPDVAGVRHGEARLLDQRLAADAQQLFGISHRNVVFIFRPGDAVPASLDGHAGAVAGAADSHRGEFVGEVPLAEANPGASIRPPFVAVYEELAFDLKRHDAVSQTGCNETVTSIQWIQQRSHDQGSGPGSGTRTDAGPSWRP